MDELLKVLEQDSHAEPSCSSRHFYSSSGTAFGEDKHFLFGLPICEQLVDVPYIQLLLLCLIFPIDAGPPSDGNGGHWLFFHRSCTIKACLFAFSIWSVLTLLLLSVYSSAEFGQSRAQPQI